MSASMSLPSGSEVFSFLCARTDAGHLLDQCAIEEEPLATTGVDGMRWRTLRLSHRAFRIETVTACATFADAVISAKTYLKAKGQNCSYQNTAGSVTYSYQNLHILDVEPVPAAGPVVGGGASTGVLAHIVTVWTVMPTNFSAADVVGS
jgi:hypothetical protein